MGHRIAGDNNLWVDCIIPFEIDDSDFPEGSSNRQLINQAISHWNTRTPIRLVPRNGEANFVVFKSHTELCQSKVGMVGGCQSISCALGSEFGRGSIIHEIGHAVGLFHEHQRDDRFNFITILEENIKEPDKKRNFDPPLVPANDVFLYDYDSIMHYSRTAFAKPGTETIVPVDPNAEIGQTHGLSPRDINTVQNMYGTLLTPQHISFGRVPVGDIKTRQFAIVNPSQQDMTITISDLGTGPIPGAGPFLHSSSPKVIKANETIFEVVEFNPLGGGKAKGELEIFSPAMFCTRIITLAGEGITTPFPGTPGPDDPPVHPL